MPSLINHRSAGRDRPSATEVASRRERLVAMVELLFFAYRDFTSDGDKALAELGFGRAHHRVVHFVDRYPGMRVADLLDILQITKQSLARVLKQLVAKGFIEQRAGTDDRRERLLYTTGPGRELARRLVEPQIRRMAGAMPDEPGAGEFEAVERFLLAMITESERDEVLALIDRAALGAAGPGRTPLD